MRRGKRFGALLLTMALTAGWTAGLQAGAASEVQYYQTVASIFNGDSITGEAGQALGMAGMTALGTAGIDSEDKKEGTGSFFQKSPAASSSPLSIWICGDDKWDGAGYVNAAAAEKPGFAMWYYIDDVSKMAEQGDGAFLRIKFGSNADKSISRNDNCYYMLWVGKEAIKTGWNYIIVELDPAQNGKSGSYTSEVDGFKCDVTTGGEAVDFSKIDWFVLEAWPGGKMTYKLDYISLVDLAVKRDAPSGPDDIPEPPATTAPADNPTTTATAPAETTATVKTTTTAAGGGTTTTTAATEDGGGSPLVPILVTAGVIILLAGGGAAYYFLVIRKKTPKA